MKIVIGLIVVGCIVISGFVSKQIMNNASSSVDHTVTMRNAIMKRLDEKAQHKHHNCTGILCSICDHSCIEKEESSYELNSRRQADNS